MTRKIILDGATVAMLGAALATPAHAQGGDDPAEANAFLSSGMTIAEAVAAAQQSGGGTAMSAAWEPQGSGAPGFEVELAKNDGTVTTVVVDPANGSVSAKLAKADRGHEDENEAGDRDEGEDGDQD